MQAIKKSFFHIFSLLALGAYKRLPIFGSLRASIAIVRNGDLYLVIDRSDRRGYCFPGGLALPWEDDETTLSREIREETGLCVVRSMLKLRYFSRAEIPCRISVYDVDVAGTLNPGSWEGSTVWSEFSELQKRIVQSQRPVLACLAPGSGFAFSAVEQQLSA